MIALWRSGGFIEPLMVCLIDGRTFHIDEVLRNAEKCSFSRDDLVVFRYDVRVEASIWRLYREDVHDSNGLVHRWYVKG